MSTKSVKTRAWEQLQIERNIRPYRHIIFSIEAYQLASGSTVYSELVNEISKPFIKSLNTITTNDGIYVFNVNLSGFKNLNNVEMSAGFSFTSDAGFAIGLFCIIDPVANSFTFKSYDEAGVAIGLDGKVIVTIKEYYA